MTATSNAKTLAQDLLRGGEIDQAIALYQRLDSNSAHVLHMIGVLYAEYNGDYQSAINYFEQALEIQEKVHNSIFLVNEVKENCFSLYRMVMILVTV